MQCSHCPRASRSRPRPTSSENLAPGRANVSVYASNASLLWRCARTCTADELTNGPSFAQWYCDNRLTSPNARWMIQIPRLYEEYRKAGFLRNFQELIDNILAPLFEVSLDPATDPKLDTFPRQVVGFDCVDDERKLEHMESSLLHPAEWTGEENPTYTYWSYFVYANLRSLNQPVSACIDGVDASDLHLGKQGSI